MRRIITLIFAAGLLGWVSCDNPFAPANATGNEGKTLLVTEQKTPDEVLQNFRYAYTFKDSLVYSDLLDSSFTFVSWNFNVSPPEPINWGRDVELRTAGRMFRFFNTLDLTFNVIIRDTVGVDPQDQKPNQIEHTITFTLTLDGGRSIPTLIGEVRFSYARREGKWLITRWEDRQI